MPGGMGVLGEAPTKEVFHHITGNCDLIHVAKGDEWRSHLTETELLGVRGELVCWVECLGADLTGQLGACDLIGADDVGRPV